MRLALALACLILIAESAAALARPVDAGSGALCERLAGSIRRYVPGRPPIAWRTQGDGLTLTALSPEAHESKPPPKFKPPNIASLNDFREASAEGSVPTLFERRVGDSDVFAFETVQGSLYCESYWFFRRARGRVVPIGAPLHADANSEGSGFCWGNTGWFGSIFGHPVFVKASMDWLKTRSEFEVAPWLGSGWGQACRVSVIFSPVFAIRRAFYPGAPIAQLPAIALRIIPAADSVIRAKQRGAPAKPLAANRPLSPSQSAEFAAMETLAKARWALPTTSGSLPIFGHPLGEYVYVFSWTTTRFPLVVAGRLYLARVGHSALGWKDGPDYLMALYAMRGGKLMPAASLVLSMLPGRLRSVTVAGPARGRAPGPATSNPAS